MVVYVIVHHYDRGSDEVDVHGVFKTLAQARLVLAMDFKGFAPIEEWSIEPVVHSDDAVLETWHYEDMDEMGDRVMIIPRELE